MKKETAIRLIAEIKANYRYTYRDMSEAEMRAMGERWFDCLKSFSDEKVEQAFKTALCKLSVPPTIADIIGIILRQEKLGEPSDMELWQRLKKAVGESCQMIWTQDGYRSLWEIRGSAVKDIYEKLPIAIKAYVDFESFCDLGGLTDAEMTYERGRFLKKLPDIRESLREARLSGLELPKITGGERGGFIESGRRESV